MIISSKSKARIFFVFLSQLFEKASTARWWFASAKNSTRNGTRGICHQRLKMHFPSYAAHYRNGVAELHRKWMHRFTGNIAVSPTWRGGWHRAQIALYERDRGKNSPPQIWRGGTLSGGVRAAIYVCVCVAEEDDRGLQLIYVLSVTRREKGSPPPVRDTCNFARSGSRVPREFPVSSTRRARNYKGTASSGNAPRPRPRSRCSRRGFISRYRRFRFPSISRDAAS